MTRAEVYGEHFFGTPLEIKLLLGALVLGMLLGTVFDILRALRLSFRHGSAAVFFEDFVFAVLFGTAFYTYCTALCRGEIRGFVFLGMVIGFSAYIATLGRAVTGAVAWVVKYIKKGCIRLGNLLKKIINFLAGLPVFRDSDNNF